jgi:hypothetical protein
MIFFWGVLFEIFGMNPWWNFKNFKKPGKFKSKISSQLHPSQKNPETINNLLPTNLTLNDDSD